MPIGSPSEIGLRSSPAEDEGDHTASSPPADRAKAPAGMVVRRAAGTGARKVAVHAASKNPYALAVVAAIVVMLFVVLAPLVWLATGTGNPNPLALQLAHVQTTAGGSTADIPPVVYAAYVQAAASSSTFNRSCGLRPAILAGIGWKETMHGTFGGAVAAPDGTVSPPIIGIALDGTSGTRAIRDSDNGDWDNDTVWDRAVGPMQFIPSSWRIYGQDGNSDGVQDPHNIHDAALAAVAHLCSAAPVDMNASEDALRQALFAYNQSSVYVDEVMQRIAYYDIALAGFGFSADPSALLASPNFEACVGAINDLETGQVDPRVISVLSAIVQTHSIYVCPLKAGHYQCVGGGSLATRPTCTESNHWHGRGVDISLVDGGPVTSANRGAYAIVEWFTTFPAGDPTRPNVGSPWPEFSALPGFFSDSDHLGHIHLGFCGPRWSGGVWSDSCA